MCTGDGDDSGTSVPVYYNGFRADTDIRCGEAGVGPYAHRLGIENMAETGVQGRGILINLVKAFGPGRTWVDYDMLMRAIDAQRVDAREGDMLLLYTGYADAVMTMNRQPDEAKLQQTGGPSAVLSTASGLLVPVSWKIPPRHYTCSLLKQPQPKDRSLPH